MVPAMNANTTVVGAQKCCALHHSEYDWKATQMNMIYEFELAHNAAEVTETVCRAKGEGTVHHSTVNR